MIKLINSPSVFSPSSYSTQNSTSIVATNGTSKSTGSLVNDTIILAIKAFKHIVCKPNFRKTTPYRVRGKYYKKLCFYGISENDVPYAIQFNDYHDTDDNSLQNMLTKCMDTDVCVNFTTNHDLYEATVTDRDMYITNFGAPFAPCLMYLRLKPGNNKKFFHRHHMPEPLTHGSNRYTTDSSQWGGTSMPTYSYASDEAIAHDLFISSKKRSQPNDTGITASFILATIKQDIQLTNITDMHDDNVIDISHPNDELVTKKRLKNLKQCINLLHKDDELDGKKENNGPKQTTPDYRVRDVGSASEIDDGASY
jgi:hypothetical protein